MASTNDLVRIVVADDNEQIRGSLCALLHSRSDWTVCGEATNGAEVVAKAVALRPDVILMDLSMPLVNGFEAAKRIHEQVPESEILIVTEHDLKTLAHMPTLPGVRGFVRKGPRQPRSDTRSGSCQQAGSPEDAQAGIELSYDAMKVDPARSISGRMKSNG